MINFRGKRTVPEEGKTPDKKQRLSDGAPPAIEDWDAMKVTQLKEHCRNRDINMSGTKEEIIARLRRHGQGKEPTKTQIQELQATCNRINRMLRDEDREKLNKAMQPYQHAGFSRQQCKKLGRQDLHEVGDEELLDLFDC